MLRASANHLRPTSLELGGKSPVVVFDDAREIMPALLDWVMLGIFCTTGQICSATSRLIVQDTLHDELLAQLKLAAAEL
jgi:acyl-CoA reductase-like NAD-dependent aldehyde dehydrogenase